MEYSYFGKYYHSNSYALILLLITTRSISTRNHITSTICSNLTENNISLYFKTNRYYIYICTYILLYYILIQFAISLPLCFKKDFAQLTAAADSNKLQPGDSIVDHFLQCATYSLSRSQSSRTDARRKATSQ